MVVVETERGKIIYVDEWVETKWASANIEWYKSKGYEYTKGRDPLTVRVTDLAPQSNAKVVVQCPECGEHRQAFQANIYKTQRTICYECTRGINKIDITKQRFGKLIAVKALGSNDRGDVVWLCHCDCGNEHIARGNSLRDGSIQSCGCLRADIAPRGEMHHWYNADLTEEERELRRSYPEYRSWRTAVFERDGYTCQACGDARGGNLTVHHLYSYSNFPDFRTDTTNGITLCLECHTDFHNWMGNSRIPCVPKDFGRWINQRNVIVTEAFP